MLCVIGSALKEEYNYMEKRVHLGCGENYLEGYINVDNMSGVKKDLEADLTKPLPFEDNSIDYILCWNVMEHLDMNMIRFMEEIHRVLKPGGKFRFRVPLAGTYIDYKDPEHVNHFSPHFLKFFNGKEKGWYTGAVFGGKIWVTPPFFHTVRLPGFFYFFNSFINNLTTGLEGEFIKK
jgi:SAM-dependent methyltransferase